QVIHGRVARLARREHVVDAAGIGLPQLHQRAFQRLAAFAQQAAGQLEALAGLARIAQLRPLPRSRAIERPQPLGIRSPAARAAPRTRGAPHPPPTTVCALLRFFAPLPPGWVPPAGPPPCSRWGPPPADSGSAFPACRNRPCATAT